MTLFTFKIESEINNLNTVLFPSLLKKGGKIYLVDCGYEETFENFQVELNKLNIHISQIDGIIISHDDIDHLGGLKAFKEYNPAINIYCGALEETSVSGRIKSERLIQAENLLDNMPGEHRVWALNFIESLKKIKRFNVDKTFQDQETFEGDVVIIHTPGHTKGHISLFIPDQKTLIANDALVIENDEFEIANPSFTLDINSAIRSVEKIKALNPEKIICYHGGIMQNDIEKKLSDLIGRYKTEACKN